MSGECYIGSAVNLKKRFSEYFRESYITHPSRRDSLICYALVKFGHQNFSLSILEYCKKEKVLEREQFYLDYFNPVYNILKYAYSSEGYKHTVEIIQKMSLVKKGKFLKENNDFNSKTHIEEVKKLIRQTTFKRIKPNNAKPVLLQDSYSNTIESFKSITELSFYLKADKATLAKYRDYPKFFRDLYLIKSI
jgi:group I intron endonuclease